MLTDATLRTNKSEILQNKYIEMINKGVNPDEILVLCLNSYKKQAFLKAAEEKITVSTGGKYNIQTFFGLCYNAISDNWCEIENSINFGNTSFLPNLCGLELSRRLLSDSITGDSFTDYFSKTNLLHQLFKRMQLMVLNALTDEQVEQKSRILKEAFFEDSKKTYLKFKQKTLQYRSFDYLRQLSILPFIVKKTEYFKKIKYLFVDDADEMTFAELSFLKEIRPYLKDFFITYDSRGASRCGYLSAYKTAVFEFEKLFGESHKTIENNDISSQNAETLYINILKDKKTKLKNFEMASFIRRLDMLDSAYEQIKKLFASGVKPKDILIITPVVDDMLKSFVSNFESQIISGSEKPKDTRVLRNAFTFLKMINSDWNIKVEPADLRFFFFDCVKIPRMQSQKAVRVCLEENGFVRVDFNDEKLQKKYDDFLEFANGFENSEKPLSAILIDFFNYFAKDGIDKEDLKKFNFVLKEIRSFETAFGNSDNDLKRKIIVQFENGIISENPSVADEIRQDAVVVSTPQKVIDFEIKRKYQFWLDISSDLWTMRDTGVLYNAWVFNAEWDKKDFTFEDNLRLSQEKNARVLRKLLLCCDERVFAYFSQYDSSGCENFGTMPSYFDVSGQATEQKKTWKIIPREDQRAIIEYSGGHAAVNAVPGAGKTTVLIALLIKLIERGVSPSNIFVLTYMESAAANIREKLKRALPDLNELPNISTIHGLAFRIIKENNNYVRLNLPDNIEIIDDNTRQKIIRECISALSLEHDDYDDYEKGISTVKLSPNGIKPLKYLKNSKDFEKIYDLYEKTIKKAGYIDYDDMLRYSVKLVSENTDIKKYYNDLCHYVIEDEAQDSSELQQKLLLLLSDKTKNLLRIGDINQAITASFTDSNPKCFKEYFENSNQMVMKSSQRSSVQIQTVANELIDFAKNDEFLKDTFFDSKLTPADKNPQTDRVPCFKIFENVSDEKIFVLNKIKEFVSKRENVSAAVLLRYNYQISDWASFLSDNGLTVTMRSDVLCQKNIFKVIFSFLKFLQTPFDNKVIIALMKAFSECGIQKFKQSDYEYVKCLKTPFINENTDNFSTESLISLWWNLQFSDDLSYLSLDIAALTVGLRYFHTQSEKANVYLIATLIKRLLSVYKTQESVLEKIEQISKKPIGSSYKFFEDEKEEQAMNIRLMTMHKSKGDEFDIVFIPETTEDNYPATEDKVKIKSMFSENIRELRTGYKKRSIPEIKKEFAEETMRLIYVGFTRAKKELYVTCSQKNKNGKTLMPSVIYEKFGGDL